MPAEVEHKIKARGGAKRWRTIKKDGKLIRIAVVAKAGPRGGHTVGYKVHE
jgi:hypothetical protein